MLHTSLARITTACTAIVILWALARGRWPERVAALVIGCDSAGSILFQNFGSVHHGQIVVFALDALEALALLTMVTRCARTWLLWAAAFTVLMVLTHVTLMLNPDFGLWSYYTAVYIWTFGLLTALALGVALEGRTPVRRLALSHRHVASASGPASAKRPAP